MTARDDLLAALTAERYGAIPDVERQQAEAWNSPGQCAARRRELLAADAAWRDRQRNIRAEDDHAARLLAGVTRPGVTADVVADPDTRITADDVRAAVDAAVAAPMRPDVEVVSERERNRRLLADPTEPR